VREVDYAHHSEDQRQTAGDEKQQEPVLDSIEELRQESENVH
jgi:hypothetical protein